MAFTVPTTKALADQFLAAIEARLNQTTPPVVRAFMRVISVSMAMFGSGIYKYLSDRALQTFALTATGSDLDRLGSNIGVTRQAAIQAVVEAYIEGTSGTIIPVGTVFVARSNGETYTTTEEATLVVSAAVLHIMSATAGEAGTLAVGETLDIGTPISGADTTAETIEDEYDDGIVVAGADREADSAYRRRVLTRLRARGGGGKLADYREWAEAVDDVARAFPYSGKPVTFTVTDSFRGNAALLIYDGTDVDFDFADLGFHPGGLVTITGSTHPENNATFEIVTVAADVLTIDGDLTAFIGETLVLVNESLPGDRVVYIESESVAETAPQTTLDDVRSGLLADPATGKTRMPLGTTDERLYVESTRRTAVTTYIVNISVPSEVLTEVQAKITSAVTDYIARVCCYVDGLDYPGDRSDLVSRMSFSTIVQGVLRGYGGSAEEIHVDIGTDTDITLYQLGQGELLKLASTTPIQFVTAYPVVP